MNVIQTRIQSELLRTYHKQLYIALFGCGGVIFRTHFAKLIGKNASYILNAMIEHKLIKQQKIGRNFVIILRHSVFKQFHLDNKSVRITVKMLLHNALWCEMLLHKYNADEIDKIVTRLNMSNFSYFQPHHSRDILNRTYTFLYHRGESNLSTLQWSIDELDRKIAYIKSSTKGRKEKLNRQGVKSDDLLTLRSNDVYVESASFNDDRICLHFAVFGINKNADKLSEIITKTEKAVEDIFSDINIKNIFDIYSLSDRNEHTEKKLHRNLLAIKGNELKEDYYRENIFFHWYNCKNRLFSGIDIGKWV